MKIEYDDQKIIKHKEFRNLQTAMKECMIFSDNTGNPQCLSIEGETGAGKTTIGRSFCESFERSETENGSVVPCLFVSIPSPATIKDISIEILYQLGDPSYDKGTIGNLTTRVIGLLQRCNAKLVILDEFQHLIDKKTEKTMNQVADWLKSIIKGTGIPFVVIGISGASTKIFNQNAQLSRLFGHRKTLSEFPLRADNLADFKEFNIVVDRFEKQYLPLTIEINRMLLLHHIHDVTLGRIGNLKTLIAAAALNADQNNREHIDFVDLAIGYEKRVKNHTERDNIFLDLIND